MTTKTTGSFNNNATPPVDAQYLNILRDEMNALSVIDGTTLDSSGLVNSQQAEAVKAYVSQAGILCTDSGSSANSYILTASSPFTNPPLKTGTRVRFKTANSNTGSSTITPFGGSAITCKKSDGSTNLTTGDIPANTEVEFVYNGTNFVQSLGKVPATTTTQGVVFRKAPTIQKFTSGSGTYTTPAEVLYLRIKMVGGGGGGSGSGTIAANNHGSGANGGNTTFGTSLLTCNGGLGGGGTGSGAGGLGGATTINSPAYGTAIAGAAGVGGGTTVAAQGQFGGAGASSYFGGASGRGDVAAAANSGSGGAAGTANASSYIGGSGGAGGFIDAIIPTPSATYSYAVGSAGASGAAGTGGNAGSTGGAGYIEITEYYN